MITYMVEVARGFPLAQNDMDELGKQGWRLVGVTCTTEVVVPEETDHVPYETEAFWYYFIREEEA